MELRDDGRQVELTEHRARLEDRPEAAELSVVLAQRLVDLAQGATGRRAVRLVLLCDKWPEREGVAVTPVQFRWQLGRQRQHWESSGDEPPRELDLAQPCAWAQRFQRPIDPRHHRGGRQVHDEVVGVLQDTRLLDAQPVLARHRDRSVESAHAAEPTR